MAPRLGSGKGRGKRGGNGGDGRPLTPQDNITPAERQKAKEEAEAMQLLSIVAAVKKHDAAIATAKIPYDAAKEERRGTLLTAKKMGFHAYEIEELVKDGKAGERKNVTEAEARRHRFRKIMGLPVGLSETEQELGERLPDAERDGQFWQNAGYADGVTGIQADPPTACISAGHGNRYDKGYKDGQTILGLALAKPKEKPKEPTELDRKRAEKAEEKRVREALEKKQDPATCTICGGPEGDGPPDDVLKCPGCDADWLPREASETDAGVRHLQETDDVEGEHLKPPTEAEFEASPEELAAQALRPSVQADEGEAV